MLHNYPGSKLTDAEVEWLNNYGRGFSTAQQWYEEGTMTLRELERSWTDTSPFAVGVRSFVNVVRENRAK